MIRVEALDTYEKENISDGELGRTPKEGEVFEVTKERLSVLLGDNKYGKAFVKIVEESKTTKKSTKNK